MSWLDALVLALIQGIAEFLPVSSKGHLFLAQHVMGLSDPGQNLRFAVALHLASLAAILLYYAGAIRQTVFRKPKEILWVAVATVPVVLVGYWAHDLLQRIYGIPRLVFGGFLVTAALLWTAHRYMRAPGRGTPLTFQRLPGVLTVGIVQVLALLPGVSRSGMTVGSALLIGMDPPEAVRFSFYLGAVAIAGAGTLELTKAAGTGMGVSPWMLAVALVVTFVTSLVSLRLLERWVVRGKLVGFAVYCAAVGAAGLAWTCL